MRLSRRTIAEGAFILLAPIAAYYAFNMNLLLQHGFVDPWLYTGYGQNPSLLYDLFGWSYYGVRFPVIFLLNIFSKSFGALDGYFVIRYCIAVFAGGLIFVWARRNFGTGIAVATFVLFLCNPFFPRLVAWDYVPFLSIPMSVSGMVLWYSPNRFPKLKSATVGFLFAAAISSHFFTSAGIGLFLLLELIPRLWSRRFGALATDVVMLTIGGLTCLALGFLYMWAIYDAFAPAAVFKTIYTAIVAADSYTYTHATPLLQWGTRIWYPWVPVALVFGTGLLLGRQIFENSIEGRVWRFAALFTAFFWFEQIVRGRFVLEVFLYFNHILVAVALLFPVFLSLLFRGMQPQLRRLGIGAILAVLIGAPLIMRAAPGFYQDLQQRWAGSIGVTIAIVGIFIATCVLMRLADRRRWGVAAIVACFVLVAQMQLTVFVHEPQSIVYAGERAAKEQDEYQAALDLMGIYTKYASSRTRILNWFEHKELLVLGVSSIVLVNTIGVWWESPGLPTLSEKERPRLDNPEVRYILAMSEHPALIESGQRTLDQAGYKVRTIAEGRLGKTVVNVRYLLMEIVR